MFENQLHVNFFDCVGSSLPGLVGEAVYCMVLDVVWDLHLLPFDACHHSLNFRFCDESACEKRCQVIDESRLEVSIEEGSNGEDRVRVYSPAHHVKVLGDTCFSVIEKLAFGA